MPLYRSVLFVVVMILVMTIVVSMVPVIVIFAVTRRAAAEIGSIVGAAAIVYPRRW